jgi:hypothetical protein
MVEFNVSDLNPEIARNVMAAGNQQPSANQPFVASSVTQESIQSRANGAAPGSQENQGAPTPNNAVQQQPQVNNSAEGGNAASGAPPIAEEQKAGFDESKWFADNFGDTYKSANEIKTQLEKLSKDAQEVSKLKEQLKNAPVLADDGYLKGLNEALKKGISKKSYDLIQDIGDVNALGNEDAVKKMMKLRDGFTDAQAEARLNRKYKLGDAYKDMEDSDEVQDARLDLVADASSAREYLKKQAEEHSVSPQEKISEKRNIQWGDTISQVTETNRSYTVPTQELGDFKYEVPAEVAKEAEQYVKELMTESGFDLSQENIEFANRMFKSFVMERQFGDLVQKALTALAHKNKVDLVRATSHPQSLEQPVVTSGFTEDPGDAMLRRAYESRGYSYNPSRN